LGVVDSVADFPWEWTHVTATALVKTGAGALHTIAVNYCVGCLVTIYDGVDATGRVIGAVWTNTSQPVTLTYDLKVATGIYITIAGEGTADLTVNYV